MKCLWITTIVACFSGIWFARNSSLHGSNLVPISSMFSFISQPIQEANTLKTCGIHRTVHDLLLLHRLKVTMRLPKASTIISVI